MSIKMLIERFWKVFLLEKNNLEKALDENNENEIKEIDKILSTYYEEFSNSKLQISKEDDFYEITFLTGMEKNVQLINALVKKLAPQSITEDWIVNAYMPPMHDAFIHAQLRIENTTYTVNDFSVFYQVDEVNKMVQCKVYSEKFVNMDNNKAKEVAVYFMQGAVGECFFEAYISSVDAIVKQVYEKQVLLVDCFELLIDLIEKFEWTDYQDPTLIYRVYKLDEAKVSNEIRKDMKLIFTVHPELIQDSLLEQDYQSMEFYDFGGEFGYLYFENPYHSEMDATVRQKLEHKINELLYDKGIARSIGGAIGNTYSYIDLAIFDKEEFTKALHILNRKLSIQLHYISFVY